SIAADPNDKLQKVLSDTSEGMSFAFAGMNELYKKALTSPSTPAPDEVDDEDDVDGGIGTDADFVVKISQAANAMSNLVPELYNRAIEVSRAEHIGLSPISEDAEMRSAMKSLMLNTLMGMSVASVAYGNMMRLMSDPVEDMSSRAVSYVLL
ncbi:hypothetical protein NPIL_141991, partial [Nephila pilipes]